MAAHRHKRETNARRFPRATFVAAPLAVLATLSAVTAGVLSSTPSTVVVPEGLLAASTGASLSSIGDRAPVLSRSSSREAQQTGQKLTRQVQTATDERLALEAQQATEAAVARAKKERIKLWTTTVLNIWSAPGADARNLGELEEGKQVLVTGRKADGRVEVVLKGESRWVSAGYLSKDKPVVTGAAAGLSMAPCPDSSVENGLTSNAVAVYRSVCHAFPQITTYGGWDNHGEHASGRALDIMVSDVALGTAIAEYLKAHASELHLYDILWRQHIWTPVRAGEGWRAMPSRGSATANHYDHVHVSTY